MFDEMIQGLKEVSYVPQVKMSFISVGTLCHGVSIRDGVLKMTKALMVVLKGVRRNNIYYLMGSTVQGE